MPVVAGSLLAGKYRLERELGRGGMGSVWVAEHITLRSRVAIKLIASEYAQNDEALRRFLQEAQSASALRSPHVVQILDQGVDEGTPYIAMELLEGESLAQRLARVGRLAPQETARIITHVARALDRAHAADIVHRDLKPDNVFLIHNDDEEIAKVLDFGIAKVGARELTGPETRTGAFLGTPHYMSPEQVDGKRVDHRSDLWALSVIAFECLVGFRPFSEEGLSSLLSAISFDALPVPSAWGSVPKGFDSWFLRGCARDRSERFQSAKEAASELRALCENPLTQASPSSLEASVETGIRGQLGDSTAPALTTSKRTRPAVLWTGIVFLAVLITGYLYFSFLRVPAPLADPRRVASTGAPAVTREGARGPGTPPSAAAVAASGLDVPEATPTVTPLSLTPTAKKPPRKRPVTPKEPPNVAPARTPIPKPPPANSGIDLGL